MAAPENCKEKVELLLKQEVEHENNELYVLLKTKLTKRELKAFFLEESTQVDEKFKEAFPKLLKKANAKIKKFFLSTSKEEEAE